MKYIYDSGPQNIKKSIMITLPFDISCSDKNCRFVTYLEKRREMGGRGGEREVIRTIY